MTVVSRIQKALRSVYGKRRALIGPDANEQQTAVEMYEMLFRYYLNNGLYDEVQQGLYDLNIWTEGMAPLRNPTFSVVEFYAARLWPEAKPPIVTNNEALRMGLDKVWKWSNWAARGRLAARYFAAMGDLFIKVAVKEETPGAPKAVYLQVLDPRMVTALETDERGFLTSIRIDSSQTERDDGQSREMTTTEVWVKGEGMKRWVHERGRGADENELGAPALVRTPADLQFDFIPIAHAPFRDIGEERGAAAILHALDKIDEANRMATRLHQMLFRYNKVTEVIEGQGTDAVGRPLPPPSVQGASAVRGAQNDDSTVTVGSDRIVRLPAGWTWRQAVPAVDYSSALAVLMAHMGELERDLPELAYYRLRDKGELSGRAVRLLLSDAIDRAEEARGNGEAAIIRAAQMALTIAQDRRLIERIGDYDSGALDFTIAERPILPVSGIERAEEAKTYIDAQVPPRLALRKAGWSEEELKDFDAARLAESDFSQELLRAAEARFNAGAGAELLPGGAPDLSSGVQDASSGI